MGALVGAEIQTFPLLVEFLGRPVEARYVS